MSTDFSIDEDHPLALELKSLRATVVRYQHDSSSAAVKLQRHSLDTSYALERTQALEQENSRLNSELAVLRSHSEVAPTSAALQIPELTNALRHISDKLTAMESVLLTRNTKLANAEHDVSKTKAQFQTLYNLTSRARTQEEEGRLRERHLENALRAAQEESRISDLVVQEYADLVRSLTTTKAGTEVSHEVTTLDEKSNGSSLTLIDSLSKGKSGLHRLLEEFNLETDKLEAEISNLNSELSDTQSQLLAEKAVSGEANLKFAELQVSLDKLRVDDDTAAKMVSRYMKFSQTSNNALSTALENLKARHQATTSTLTMQIDYLQRCLLNEKRNAEKLRSALDELSEDISRETYGRRREISLRLAYLGREESLAELFRRWFRKATESYNRAASSEDLQQVLKSFDAAIEDSKGLLDTLNGQPALEEFSPGAVARVLAAQDAVEELVQELQVETNKRMSLERQLAHIQEAPPPLPVRSPNEAEMDISILADGTPASSRGLILNTPPSLFVKAPPEANVGISAPLDNTPASSKAPAAIAPAQEEPIVQIKISSPPVEPVHVSIPADLPVYHPSPRSPELIAPIPIIVNVEPPPLYPPPLSTFDGKTSQEPPVFNEPVQVADSPPSPRQLLLADLTKVKSRYEQLQHAFRGCNLALKDLKSLLSSATQSDIVDLVRIAVERLDDFNEDTRVELEIRVSDEERMTKTFETLLRVHGAIESDAEAEEVELDVRAFVDGTDKSVARATNQFSRKLDDVTHDIASVKSFLHDLSTQDPTSPIQNSPTPWSALTAGILGTVSRPSSPAPTFGAVMTSPRLRHASSFTQTRRPSFGELQDPLASLNLRIPMPKPSPPPNKFHSLPSRARTTSMMNMLGFGSRGGMLGPSTPPPPGRKVSLSHLNVEDTNNAEEEDALEDLE